MGGEVALVLLEIVVELVVKILLVEIVELRAVPLPGRTRNLLTRFEPVVGVVIAARAEGLMTGILWDLPRPLAAGVEAAIAAGDVHAPVKVGFDPTHVQPVGITAKQARSGIRPTISGHAPSPEPVVVGNGQFDVVERGDTLSGIAREHHITLARILELNPHKLANPNLIVVGEKDPGTPVAMAREIADRIAGARLVVLPGAMHCAAVEAADDFHQALRSFLDGLG